MNPTFKDTRWTMKLIRRDTRNLLSRQAKKAAKAAKALKLVEVQRHIEEPAEAITLDATRATADNGSSRAQYLSMSEHGSSTTAPTSQSESAPSTTPSTVASLYELLEGNLKELYASRDRDVSHKDRWQFRGSYLILFDAIQACASNPSFDIFRSQKPDESALLCSLLQSSSDLPIAFEIWRTILEGTTDTAKTVAAAMSILAYICPDLIADKVINDMGDPSKRTDMHDILIPRFRECLFPGYDDLVSTRYYDETLA